MTEVSHKKPSPYRWVILALCWLTLFTGVIPQFQVAGLAFRIIPEFNLSMTQFNIVFLAAMLVAVFISIPGGALGDRFGVKKSVAGSFVFTLAGVGLLPMAQGFTMLFSLLFLSGISISVLNANVSKILGAWFPREQLGSAMGMLFTGGALGMTVGLSTSAYFPTTQVAFATSAITILVVAILWTIFVKDKPKGIVDMPVLPAMEYLGIVTKSKNVWLVGVAMMFFMGCNMTFNGNMAMALTTVRGIDPKTAGLMASVVTMGTVFGSFAGPILSDRIGRIKPFLAPMGIIGGVLLYAVWSSGGFLTWVLLFLLGVIMGVSTPLLMAFPMLLKEIGPVYAGSAGGLIATLQLMGGFVIPSFIIAPLAGANFNVMFMLATLFYFLFALTTFFLPELGIKARVTEAMKFPKESADNT